MDKLKLLKHRIEARLDFMLKCPQMFGGLESVEFQFLQALTTLVFLNSDGETLAEDDLAADLLVGKCSRELALERFGTWTFLFHYHLKDDPEPFDSLVDCLQELRERVEKSVVSQS